MATRCARCQAEEVTLETFGVFRCPACGRVDADGRALDAAPSGPVEVAGDAHGSFAEPPPWTPSDVAERARAALTVAETTGPPTGFLVGVLVMAIVTLASAASSGRQWLHHEEHHCYHSAHDQDAGLSDRGADGAPPP